MPPLSIRLSMLVGLALAACDEGNTKDDSTPGTSPYSTCDVTVKTVDTPRIMERVEDSCRFLYAFFITPSSSTLEWFELETTRIAEESDDTLPERLTIGVLDSKDSTTILFEDSVWVDPPANQATIEDRGQGAGWYGLFEPNTPVPMPRGFWFVDLLTPLENCDDTLEITMTYEDVLGEDCGD